MNLMGRLERIENRIGNNCLLCGADLKARAERDKGNRAEAEAKFAQYVSARGARGSAIESFSLDAPTLARAAGVLRKIERPGFCTSCYEDRRTREQIEADDRHSAREYMSAAAAQGVSSADALKMLGADAPSVLQYVA